MTKRIIISRQSPSSYAYLPVGILIGLEGAEQVRHVQALVDTGADHTIIRASILAELGIATTGRRLSFTGAGATGRLGTAVVRLGFEGSNDLGEWAALTNTKEVGVASHLTEEMIVGLDVLRCFDLSFLRDGRVTLEWD